MSKKLKLLWLMERAIFGPLLVALVIVAGWVLVENPVLLVAVIVGLLLILSTK